MQSRTKGIRTGTAGVWLGVIVAFAIFAIWSVVQNDSNDESPDVPAGTLFPNVIEATATPTGDGSFRIDVTMSSPYDSAERYADAWRVLAPDGAELGVRELAHDHAGEQPFTRSLNNVAIPDDVDEITVEGRDQVSGWGGDTVTVPVPR